MRILVVHEVNYLEKIVYEFQIVPEMLSMLGHDVTVIDYDDSWQDRPAGGQTGFPFDTRVHERVHRAYPAAAVTVRRPGLLRSKLTARISGAISAGFEIHRWLGRNRADAILLYGVPTVGLQTLAAARRHGVPILFRAIDVTSRLVPPVLAAPTRMIERVLYNRVDGISAITPQLKAYVRSYGVPEFRVRLLASGVDCDLFSPGPRNDALMARWGIAPGDPVVLFMGTIYRFSGLDRVIRDLPALVAKHPGVKLLVVGQGEDEERLKRLAADRGMARNVVFTGLQPYALLPDVIRSSDVCINPFELNGITRDILPTKLFQYLACGKPVVATSLPGTLPFLSGEEHGMAYAALGDVVPAVDALLGDPPRRHLLGARGIAVTRGAYDWKPIAESLAGWMRSP
jgi:glycosyltransferase involved in cell wall biosynthesis